MSVLFVTGTDTGVGKTVVTAALAAYLSRRTTVIVSKPLQTGVDAVEPGDADEVRRLAGVEVHEGVRLRDALAPTTAARLAGVDLPSVKEQAAAIEALRPPSGWTLVEGAGGLLVGLDGEGRNLADLATHLPHSAFVVVVRAGLGTLNHTLLTVEALRARNLPIAGLVIGAWPQNPDLADRCNLEELPALAGLPLLGRIPANASALPPDAFRTQAQTWFTFPAFS